MPKWLGKYGRRKWKQVVGLQWPTGDVPPEFQEPLAYYCEAYDDFRTALSDIKANGTTCVSEKGGVYLHPSVTLKNQALARMKQLGPLVGWAEDASSVPQQGGGVAQRKRR